MWINSKHCIQSSCTRLKQYDPLESETFVEIGQPIEVTFGSGELFGEFNADHVWFGGIKVENQSFAMIEQERGVLSYEPVTISSHS